MQVGGQMKRKINGKSKTPFGQGFVNFFFHVVDSSRVQLTKKKQSFAAQS